MPKKNKVKLPPMVDDVRERLSSIKYAYEGLPAIVAIEAIDGEVTGECLELIGIGGAEHVVLLDCSDPEAAAKHRLAYTRAMIAQDKKLIGIAGGDSDAEQRKNSELALCRMLASIARSCWKASTESQGGGGQRNVQPTMHVTMQTEEERGYSLSEYSATDVKEAREVLIKMTNLIIRPRPPSGWLREPRSGF